MELCDTDNKQQTTITDRHMCQTYIQTDNRQQTTNTTVKITTDRQTYTSIRGKLRYSVIRALPLDSSTPH